jgi:hypothetical protein
LAMVIRTRAAETDMSSPCFWSTSITRIRLSPPRV